jgi:hypothetical protein
MRDCLDALNEMVASRREGLSSREDGRALAAAHRSATACLLLPVAPGRGTLGAWRVPRPLSGNP